MNSLKQRKVSIKPFYLLTLGSLCFPLLTGCMEDMTLTLKTTEDQTDTEILDGTITQSIELGSNLTVTAGDAITLTPTLTNIDSGSVSYQWEQTSGNIVSLTANDTPYLTFTTTENDTLEFDLTVTDSNGNEYTDSVSVDVLANDDTDQVSVQLSWDAPTLNEDGSLLTDLAGYKIYYGESETNMDTSLSVTDPLQTSYTIDELSSNNSYFFCISAYNTQGKESECSEIVEHAS